MVGIVKEENNQKYIEPLTGDVEKNVGYSTSEVDTGLTWIDGKPIYRKVYTNTFSITAGSSIKLVTMAGVSSLIKLEGFYKETASSTQYVNMNDKNGRLTSNSSGELYFESLNDRTNYTYIIITEYTKTTD